MAKKATEEIEKVAGDPAKNFFVNMLTRDIELHDAILDLLDNCVDGALRVLSEKPNKAGNNEKDLKGFQASITINPKEFKIEDNCGGIPWKIAKNYAFRMGKPKEFEKPEGTIGMVGIGMKRAIFKLGRECYVHSHHREDSFLVTVPETWFAEENKEWDFPAERERPISNNYGTIIEVSKLTEPVAAAFQSGSAFRATFEDRIGDSYSYLIDRGFVIEVNGKPVKRKSVRIFFEDPDNKKRWGGLIQPYVFRGKVENVDVFFAIGYRTAIQNEAERDQDRTGAFAEKDAGWTVVCNDRVVISNDRTILTGWGFGGVPAFHTQFSAIAGIVEFSSENTYDLPLTTTKRGLDSSRTVYTLVRSRMQEAVKFFTRHTNRWKGREDDLKDHFRKLERDGQGYDLAGLRSMAKAVTLNRVKNMAECRVFAPDLPDRNEDSNRRRISFSKTIDEVNDVSQFLFDDQRPANDVGLAAFDRVLQEARRKK